MARKTENPSPRVWLGLFLTLVLADFTFAKTTRLEEFDKPVKGLTKDGTSHDYHYDYDSFSKKDSPSVEKSPMSDEEETEIIDDEMKGLKTSEETTNGATDFSLERLDASEDLSTTVRTEPQRPTIRGKDRAIPTTTSSSRSTEILEKGKEASAIESFDVRSHALDARMTGGISNESQHDGGEKLSSMVSHREEFDADEERDYSEGHTISELAEATTSSSKLSDSLNSSSNSNIENLDVGESDDKRTISLASDTAVNHHVDSENDTGNFRENSSGTTSSHEPKNQVEVFGDSGGPAVLRISEAVANYTDFGNTTPVYTAAKPKGRTIEISADNQVTTKRAKSFDQTTTDAGIRSFPKKSVSTEKPIVSKPYPYTKTDNRATSDPETITQISDTTEQVTEEISAYENTIGRQEKTDDKIIVTEPSVLVENSIQQLKPVHDKRSGNFSRINSTFDRPVDPTVWPLITTENFRPINASENGDEESPKTLTVFGRTGQADNDVPQGNFLNISTSTERAPVILSEVTENNIETLIGRVNATDSQIPSSVPASVRTTLAVNGNDSESMERIDTVSTTAITSDEAISDRDESRATSHRFNVTNEEPTESYSPPKESFFASTEIYRTSTSNGIEKINEELETTVSLPKNGSSTTEFARESSSEIPTTVFTGIERTGEKITNVTGLEINSDNTEDGGSTTKRTSSSVEQPTTVEYEFVGLTEGENSTVSQSYFASSEKANTITTGSTETSGTTEATEETTVTTELTDEAGVTDQNETTFSRKVESTDPENSTSITTMSFEEETTTFANAEIIPEMTTLREQAYPTSSSVSEVINFTVRTTDIHPDTTTSSSTSESGDNPAGDPFEFTISGQSNYPEETTTTMMTVTVPITTEEPAAISNIEVILSSESTTAFQNPITITQATTVQIETTTDTPEFAISNDEVSLFVRIIIEGSWTDVCPLLGNLRAALANMLTEGTDKRVSPRNIILYRTQCSAEMSTSNPTTPVLLYVVDDNGDFDYTMTEQLPNFYKQSEIVFSLPIYSVEKWIREVNSPSNAIAVVAVSSVALICLVILAGLLFIMRKRQTRFNYGERCRPVSLDSYRVDSVSAYNSVRRKDLARGSKRSYGNPAFEDSSVTPSHPLNFAGLSSFCNDSNAITEEFSGIPQVSARIDELPSGAEVKNRYANVVPLPETRVPLEKINNDPLTEYINASYVRGPKNATKYYIACQAPIESTVADFWRMIWEQQSKVIIMLTDIIENGVEKCVDYIPPSEVTDCHRLYGDYQVTLKKHEAKEKYAISTLHLKNLENSTYREVSHIWYLWPTNGVPSDATGLIAILLEARALQRGAPGPIVVHCSPGTGRTGTLIALDLGIRQYEITRTIDVPRVVYTIRRDRAGAVQTKEQYAFIYKALNLYAAKLAGGALESM